METTKQKAIAELARRELARRGASPQAPVPSQRNPLSPLVAGPAFSYGANAPAEGASWKDVPGLAAKAASAIYGDLPEKIANHPIQTMGSGIYGAMSRRAEPETIPYPRPVTEKGKEMGRVIDAAGAAAGLSALASEIPGVIRNAKTAYDFYNKVGPKEAYRQAMDKLIKILQPSTKSLDSASARGELDPEYLKRTLPFVKPTKDYEGLASDLSSAKVKSAQEMKALMSEDNFILGNEFLDPLKQHIRGLASRPQTEDVQKELQKALDVYDAYNKWVSKAKRTRLAGQLEKEHLQRETEPLLKKLQAGLSVDRDPDVAKAKNLVRGGLRRETQAGDERVINAAENYSALKQTAKEATHMRNVARKAPDKNFLEKIPVVKQIMQGIARNKPYSMQIATEALNLEPSLSGRTTEIARLYEKARALETGNVPGVPGGPIPTKQIPQVARGLIPSNVVENPSAVMEISGPSQRSILPAPKAPKQIGVSPKYGEGFVRNSPEEAAKAVKDFAFRYGDFSKKPDIQIISGSRPRESRFGIGTYRKALSPKSIGTALQKALERARGK